MGATYGGSAGATYGTSNGARYGTSSVTFQEITVSTLTVDWGAGRNEEPTGATYGQASGATYGELSGATYGGDPVVASDTRLVGFDNATIQTTALTVTYTPLSTTPVYQASVQPLTIDYATPDVTETGFGTAEVATDPLTITYDTGDPLIGYAQWVLGGQPLERVTDEVATPKQLSLTFRIATQALLDNARDAKSDEGQVDVLTTDDGGFTAVGRAGGDNEYTLDPPVTRQPLRQQGTAYVDRYEETLVSREVESWDLELDLQHDADRTDTPSISETVGTGEWGFTTRFGTIATRRVDAEFLGTGADGVERFEVVARLTFDQAHTFEAALAKLDGTRVRTRADTTNVVVDETGGDVTVTVDSPTEDVISDGDYAVTEWESTRLNDAYNEISFELAPV